MTVLVSLVAALRKAAEFNKHELVAPRVILWPDTERLWASCIEAVRGSLPALWTLGDYAPETATGPAAWLRHRLDTHVGDQTPVIYLPGIGRGAFRSADQCPKEATHLFALQFQGQFWSQKNGKDWTPAAFLANAEGGLGLDVAGDQDTRKAIQECLRALVRVEVARLREHRLEAADFRALVTTDPPRTLLRWMGAPDQVKAELGTAEWGTFCAVCRTMYGFEPAGDGPLAAAEKLAQGKGAWPTVWQRYKEAPRSYPGVKELLHAMYPLNLFDQQVEYRPRWNQQAEERLEEGLLGLAEATPKDALAAVQMLAAEHAHRAGWVWAVLGDSPLARAIVHLRDVADVVQAGGSPSTWEGLADYYRSTAWKADYAVLRALAEARSAAATKAVTVAVRAVYLPWLERLATLTQSLMASYPTRGPSACRALAVEAGTVHVFADGLRFDLARALEERIAEAGASITTELRCDWSALPTVTATAKPAFQPLAARLGGPLTGTGFQSKELATGKDLVQARFKQLVAELGMPFLESSDVGLPIGCAWTEHGSVDTYGHEQGAKLAWRIEEELSGLHQRITDLLRAGWTKVNVVTDHGWLMVPGGLPKIDLPLHLTASRWSRCAMPEPGAKHGYPVTSWFWDPAEAVVLAPGVACFVAGKEYAHGGVTMQEALVPCLTVTAKQDREATVVVLKEHRWVGLRLQVVFDGAAGLTVDLRGKVADPTTTVAANPATIAPDGLKTSLLVPDDDRLGTTAHLVVIDRGGACIFKHAIVIGEN
jgi:hypothetical protein